MVPTTRIKPFVGRRGGFGANSEQRAKGVEGVKAAVEPKSELVEVGLQVLMADRAVVRPGVETLCPAQ